MILDTFYFLFKSNADDLKKGTKEAEKAGKELEDQTKKTSGEVEKLGQNFTKTIEAATGALAAAFSFGAVKSGILNTAELNRQLSIQGQLMGQNAQTIKAYGFAFEQLGGDAQEAQSILTNLFQKSGEAGLPAPDFDVYFRRVRAAIKGMTNPAAQAQYLRQLGITGPGGMRLAEMSDDEFERFIAQKRKEAELTREQQTVTENYGQAWSRVKQAMDSVYTKMGEDLLPLFTKLVGHSEDFGESLKNNRAEMYAFFGGMMILMPTLAIMMTRMAGAVGLLGAAAATALLKIAAPLALLYENYQAVTDLATGRRESHIGRGASWVAGKLDNFFNGDEDKRLRARMYGNSPRAESFGSTQDAMKFWMGQGFSREQAAGIVANEMRESAGDANAVGDGGKARGLYQWHPDRRAKILDELGIDVAKAGADEQRYAAAWELRQMGLDAGLRNTRTPDEAAAFFSRKFEIPANGDFEALKRGQMALQIAGSSPINTSSAVYGGDTRTTSLKIDNINVQTQATDASGIAAGITQEMNSQMRSALAGIDDGVAY